MLHEQENNRSRFLYALMLLLVPNHINSWTKKSGLELQIIQQGCREQGTADRMSML